MEGFFDLTPEQKRAERLSVLQNPAFADPRYPPLILEDLQKWDFEYQKKIGDAEKAAALAAADTRTATAVQTAQTDAQKCKAQDTYDINILVATFNAALAQNAKLVTTSTQNLNQSSGQAQDLSGQIQQLEQQQAELKASIEQHSRDFVDLRDAMPELIPNTNVHILDDYTMWVLVLSYSLFIVSVIFYYCHIHNYALNSILISTISAGIITVFIFILMILLL
jgi:hypothetical protein